MAPREVLDRYTAELPRPDDFNAFRNLARQFLGRAISPDRIGWRIAGEAEQDLFGAGEAFAASGDQVIDEKSSLAVPRTFLRLAKSASLHSDPRRFDLLYRLLWRMRGRPRLIDDAADADVRTLHELDRQVRRDIHKMRAFVRFREVEYDERSVRYVAWFEPQHHILRANADFFVKRFTAMQWSILTPIGTLHWDGTTLLEGPPADRSHAPAGDDAEDLWKRYYSAIFNPARLKVRAMLKEMPKRYWHNMPETALIPELIASAQAREAAMVATGASTFDAAPPGSLDAIAAELEQCRRCEIGCNGTRAVAGRGCTDSGIMIIGEQPGDREEATGRPFVGPAGEVLGQALERAGIDRDRVWLTNAVKHFKHTLRGKQRLHQNPSAREIDICRWWLDAERDLVKPKLTLALGASAARSVLGRTPSVQQVRGQALKAVDGSELWVTVHPAYLLRLDGEAAAREAQLFARDLSLFSDRAAELGLTIGPP